MGLYIQCTPRYFTFQGNSLKMTIYGGVGVTPKALLWSHCVHRCPLPILAPAHDMDRMISDGSYDQGRLFFFWPVVDGSSCSKTMGSYSCWPISIGWCFSFVRTYSGLLWYESFQHVNGASPNQQTGEKRLVYAREIKIRRPAGVSGGSCLFVVVLSVLSLSLSRLSPWRGFLPRLTLPLALLRFVFIFPYVVVGSALPTAPQHRLGFAHLEVISMVVSVFCCVCHRFAPSLLISNTWSTGFCAKHLLHA